MSKPTPELMEKADAVCDAACVEMRERNIEQRGTLNWETLKKHIALAFQSEREAAMEEAAKIATTAAIVALGKGGDNLAIYEAVKAALKAS